MVSFLSLMSTEFITVVVSVTISNGWGLAMILCMAIYNDCKAEIHGDNCIAVFAHTYIGDECAHKLKMLVFNGKNGIFCATVLQSGGLSHHACQGPRHFIVVHEYLKSGGVQGQKGIKLIEPFPPLLIFMQATPLERFVNVCGLFPGKSVLDEPTAIGWLE